MPRPPVAILRHVPFIPFAAFLLFPRHGLYPPRQPVLHAVFAVLRVTPTLPLRAGPPDHRPVARFCNSAQTEQTIKVLEKAEEDKLAILSQIREREKKRSI